MATFGEPLRLVTRTSDRCARRRVSAVALGVLTLIAACQHSTLPPPPTEAEREAFGVIMVAQAGDGAARVTDAIGRYKPSAGSSVYISSDPYCQTAVDVVWLAVFLGEIVASAASGPGAELAKRIEDAKKAMRDAIARAQPGASLQRAFISATYRVPGLRVHAGKPTSWTVDADELAALHDRGIDTLILLRLVSMRGSAERQQSKFPLEFHAQVRVIRAADGTTMYTARLVHRDPTRRHSLWEWAEIRGQATTAAAHSATGQIADKFVEEVFLRYRL